MSKQRIIGVAGFKNAGKTTLVERLVTELAAQEPVSAIVIAYLNRLSDLLFVMARVLARREAGQEVLWKRDR